jgi:hypothetical protein
MKTKSRIYICFFCRFIFVIFAPLLLLSSCANQQNEDDATAAREEQALQSSEVYLELVAFDYHDADYQFYKEMEGRMYPHDFILNISIKNNTDIMREVVLKENTSTTECGHIEMIMELDTLLLRLVPSSQIIREKSTEIIAADLSFRYYNKFQSVLSVGNGPKDIVEKMKQTRYFFKPCHFDNFLFPEADDKKRRKILPSDSLLMFFSFADTTLIFLNYKEF